MLASAEALGLRFERISAVDLESIRSEAPPAFRPFRLGNAKWTLRPFEIAVFESHRRAWRAVVDRGAQLAVVMEDDLLFSAGFAHSLTVLASHASRYDVVRLNHSIQRRRLGPPLALDRAVTLRPVHQDMGDAGCYLLTCAAAEELLRQSDAYCAHLDDFVFSPARGLRTFQLFPPVCGQAIHFGEAAAIRSGFNASTRLEQIDRAPKGPLHFRLWKEVRRLGTVGARGLHSRLVGGCVVDMSRHLGAFKPMPSDGDRA